MIYFCLLPHLASIINIHAIGSPMQNRHIAIWLTGIACVAFLMQNIIPGFTGSITLVSAFVWQRPWTLLTSIFAHANIVHILFNGYALALFGSILEEKVGTFRFITVFLLAGLASGFASTFFYGAVLGASGAIFGILGALAVLEPFMTVFVYYIPLPMFVAAFIWAALDALGFVTGVQAGGLGNVANAGHIAGLATGILAGLILRGKKPVNIGFWGLGRKKNSFMTAEEFDKWEKENMSADEQAKR